MSFVPARDFDDEIDEERRVEEHRRNAIYTGDEMTEMTSAARAEGRKQGLVEGEAAARARALETATERTLAALEAIAPAIRALVEGADAHRAALEAQVIDFVLSVFRRVLPELMRSQASARAEAEVRRAVGLAIGSGKLSLLLPEDAQMTTGEELARRVREAGFEGRVEISADPAMAPGDVHAEWDSGFMDYSYAALCEQILGALENAAPQRRAENDKKSGRIQAAR